MLATVILYIYFFITLYFTAPNGTALGLLVTMKYIIPALFVAEIVIL